MAILNSFLDGLYVFPYPICHCIVLLAAVVPSHRQLKAPPSLDIACFSFTLQSLLFHTAYSSHMLPLLSHTAGHKSEGMQASWHKDVHTTDHRVGITIFPLVLTAPCCLHWWLQVRGCADFRGPMVLVPLVTGQASASFLLLAPTAPSPLNY